MSHLARRAEAAVVELAEAGQLPGRLLGGTWRFSRTDLIGWLSHTELTPVRQRG